MSALYGMQDVLNPQFLSAAYTKVASATVENPMLDFYSKPQQYDGDTIEMVVYAGEREAAPVNSKGAAARTLDMRAANKQYFTPIHAYNEVTVPMASVEYLRNEDSPQIQDRGMQELRRQMELFGRRHRMLRSAALAKALVDGIIYFDKDGGILESSSGAYYTVDLQVGATHKSKLAHASNSGSDIIGTSWDSAGASILTDLEQITEAAEYDMVPPPRHVWLHTTAKSWIRANTELKSFLVLNSDRAENSLQSFNDTLIVGDYTFHFYAGTYVGADGSTVRPLIPKTQAIITPDLGEWFRHYETGETVPTGEGVASTFEEAMSKTQKVFGDFAYLRVDDNPVKVTMRMGMNFLYAFADPNAVWMPLVKY